jgi:putative nucleotidyltransferase with HDIG domain
VKHTSLQYRLFALTLLTAGGAVLAAMSQGSGAMEHSTGSPSTLILWLAMISVAAVSPVPLPSGSGMVRLTAALDLAALLAFGPLTACWVAVYARLVSNLAEKWNPLVESVARLGRAALAVGAAGTVYVTLGGKTGAALFIGFGELGPLAAAAAVYLLTWAALSAAEFRLHTPDRFRESGLAAIGSEGAFHALLLPFGVLLALTQIRIGPVGSALFLIPLLVTRYAMKLWLEAKRTQLSSVRELMSEVDATDPFTRGHCLRVSTMCVAVARRLGLPAREIEEIEYACLVHDIGRNVIQREVLDKPGNLDESEQSLIRTHPRIGADLILRLRFLPEAAEIVRCHHEQPDGRGYPRGLSGGAIPMGSRILMAVAAFDAMTSDRPYRRGLSPEAAFEELLSHAGTQFFPDVVEALIDLYSEDALFAEMGEEELEKYARGEIASRAVEVHLERRGFKINIPDKSGIGDETSGLPELDLPEPDDRAEEATLYLSEDTKVRLETAARTDRGCVRTNNEDAFGIMAGCGDRPGGLLVLADGMGGAAAGEVASRMAVEAFASDFFALMLEGGPRAAMVESMTRANQRIHARAAGSHRLGGMGTTCTAAVFHGLDLYVGHVGDSRAYLVTRQEITQLTTDHNLAAELRRASGDDGPSPVVPSHVLTRCLGEKWEIEVEASPEPITLRDGDAVFLCSDGLWEVVSEEEIREIVFSSSPAAACQTLVDLARSRGGPDNITVQVGRVAEARRDTPPDGVPSLEHDELAG